jgi:iron complex transport system ATP-binding protein
MRRRGNTILSFKDLEIGFISKNKKRILTPPLNASASNGELVALLGHNGVGKSTLLRTIVGLQEPLGGTIYLEGVELSEYDRVQIARNVGYISTEAIKIGNMNVYELVALGRFPHTNWAGKINDDDHNIIMDSIKRVGMLEFTHQYINELSDGERQRAMIARILAQDTPLLIMDEPTAFLDIKNKFEIVHLMHSLTRLKDKTVLFSTHDLQTAINEADKIWLIMDDGIIEGAPEDLIINGSFDSLFSDPLLKFSQTDGTFGIAKEYRNSIFLEGKGLERRWTEKALNRIGYVVTESIVPDRIKVVLEAGIPKWVYNTNKSQLEFNSLYELVRFFERNEALIAD